MANTDRSITYILRCHSTSCLSKLRAALVSISEQHYQHKKALVALQNFSEKDESEVKLCLKKIAIATRLEINISNIKFPKPGDYRGALLNRSVALVDSRYVAFLDYDDIVYPNHAETLITDLESEPNQAAAASFGKCISAVYEDLPNNEINIIRKSTFCDAPSVTTCVLVNCFPIHSYVIDRYRVKQFPRFNETSPYFEDYYFLLALIESHPVSTKRTTVAVCEYRINTNNTNTIVTEYGDSQPDANKKRGWIEAGEAINRFKSGRSFVIPYDEIRRGLNVRLLTRQPFFRGLFICHIAKKIRRKHGEKEACEFLIDPKQYAKSVDKNNKTLLMKLLF